MTDRLSLTRAFEGIGAESAAAERLASEIYAAIQENVATRQDLQKTEGRLKFAVEQIERPIDTMVNRLMASVIIGLVALFAALHYWPPHA